MTTTLHATPLTMILERLPDAKQKGGEWSARCPAHHDAKASLTVTESKEGKALIHCHAGCKVDDICSAMGLTLADLFPASNNGKADIVAAYDYCDESGKLLSQAVRLLPKDFRQRKPKPGGEWEWSVKGVKKVPYRLPELLTDPTQTVFIVEGEKDCDRLASLGILATCNAGGAGKWTSQHAKHLQGRRVIVLPDNDTPGKNHAAKVAQSLQGIAESIKVVELPGLPTRGDVSDWLNAGGTRDELLQVGDDAPDWTPPSNDSDDDLPEVLLPGGAVRVIDSAKTLGQLLAGTESAFRHGGAPATLEVDEQGAKFLSPIGAASLSSALEHVATLKKLNANKETTPTICSETTARLILKAKAFKEQLPIVKVVTSCPVLVEHNGNIVEVVGYDKASGTLADGVPTHAMTIDQAKQLILDDLLGEFSFVTPGDRARAAAALITPALVFGGLLAGRPPLDMAEADESQSGKGYRHRLTGAVYGREIRSITQKKGGVGSIEEAFDAAQVSGAPMTSLENMRGNVASQALESFLTEPTYNARIPYAGNSTIDTSRRIVMLTSNKVETTPDLANRASSVRILKRHGHHFKQYPEGDLLAHVKANSTDYLSAVHCVAKAWHAAGKPKTDTTEHDFRAWAQTLDWICRNILEVGPLLDGHREVQRRLSNPSLNWIRDMALGVKRADRLGNPLRAHDLLDVLSEDPDADSAKIAADLDLDDDDQAAKALRAIGRQMKRAFKKADQATVDAFTISREETSDDQGRPRKWYVFADNNDSPASIPPIPASPHQPTTHYSSPEIEGGNKYNVLGPCGDAGHAGECGEMWETSVCDHNWLFEDSPHGTRHTCTRCGKVETVPG